MTDESEKAAKWEILEQYQQAKSHLATLENRMNKLGTALQEFGRTLSSPHGIGIDIGSEHLTGVNMVSKTKVFQLSKAEITWEGLTGLIADHRKTDIEKQRLYGQFKDMGLGDIAT